MQEALNDIKIQSSNNSIIQGIKTVFNSSEIDSFKNERLDLVLRVNNDGKVFYVYFSTTKNSKLENVSLEKISQLEDKLISTLLFKIPDKDINCYTLYLSLSFIGVHNNTYVFPKKMYANP
jgi:hypothetical protein